MRADGSDRTLKDIDMSVLTGHTGPMVMISRVDLVRLLEARCQARTFGGA